MSWLLTLRFELAVIYADTWENIHSHTVCTHLNCPTTCKCTWFRKVSWKVEHSTHGDLYHHVHAKWFLLWCVPVSNTCFNPASQAYTTTGVHYMAAWHACVIGRICTSFGMFTCCFSRAYLAMEKANNGHLYAVHVQPLTRREFPTLTLTIHAPKWRQSAGTWQFPSYARFLHYKAPLD